MDIDYTMNELTDNLQGESGVESLVDHKNSAADIIVGIFFSVVVLTSAIYLSRMHTIEERQEIALAERSRIEAETKQMKEMESYRVKIIKAIDNYKIRLTNYASSNPLALSLSGHNSTLPIGNHEEDDECASHTLTSKTFGSDDHEDTETEEIEQDLENNIRVTVISTLIDDIPHESPVVSSTNDEDEEQGPKIPSSLSSAQAMAMSRSKLKDAVTHDPCPICLDHFRPGDVIVCCSNNINGQKPHVFHEACSLEYLVSHSDGMKAPCPICKRSFLPSGSEEQMCLSKCSQPSMLNLPELTVSGAYGEDDDDDYDSSNNIMEV